MPFWNGAVLASADKGEYEVVEGNIYFPPDAINRDYFRASDMRTPADLRDLAALQGIALTLHKADQSMPTVEAAAAALGIQPDEMTKNLVFLVAGEPYLVIARGTGLVDKQALARHLGVGRKQVKLATPAQTLEASGFVAGCVPSFGHKVPLPTLIDSSVLELARVYGGTSDPTVLISLAPADVLALTHATILPLT